MASDDHSDSSTVSDEEHYFIDENLENFILSNNDIEEFKAPPQHKWKDFVPMDHPAIVTINQSREQQWSFAKEEIKHAREKVRAMIQIDEDSDMEPDEIIREIILFFVGSESRIGKFLQEQLLLSKQKYVGFLHTVCLQAAYDVSANQLYHQISKLRDSLLITEEDYIAVWSWMAHRMRVEAAQIGTSRSTIPLWQHL